MTTLVYEPPVAQTSYIPVSVMTLRPDQSLGIALFLREPGARSYFLYRDKGIPLNASDLEGLQARGSTTLYAKSDEFEIYQQYLRGSLDSALADESVPVANRFSHLNEVVRDVLAESFHRGETSGAVTTCRNLAEKTVDLICRKDAVASELLGVMYHDYHTFTHSANVSFYCTILAKSLGISSRADLHRIAVGGMLHDLGKLDISDRILTKAGTLTSAERNIVKQHPRTGFLKLSRRHDLSHGQLMMVYQHHERIDGKGYPVGHVGSEIHDWGKICAVVDVYEALSSNRPYRCALGQDEVFRLMGRDAGLALDKDLIACWMQAISTT
ncbi:MAG: HD domain-containing protein [Planctomycetia bacterium]|nr:HD domain-containing protein [Planctomycetia bacterium]